MTEEKEAAGEDSSLIPHGKVPKGIDSLARAMKTAEIARKGSAAVEGEKRDELCALMIQLDCHRFQIDIDGVDYEFSLENLAKVKSKKLHKDD